MKTILGPRMYLTYCGLFVLTILNSGSLLAQTATAQPPTASIGDGASADQQTIAKGIVFEDANGNGIQDADEKGLRTYPKTPVRA